MGTCCSTKTAAVPPPESPTKEAAEPKKKQRQNVIMPEHLDSMEGYEPAKCAKGDESKAIIQRALDNSVIFTGLDPEQKASIIDSMQEYRVKTGELLIEQGDAGDAFYVVETGRFEILVEGVGKVAESSTGGSFGELALIMNQPRAASVRALEDGLTWKIDRKPFRYFLAASSNSLIDEYYRDLQAVQVLAGLPSAHLYKLAAHTSKERHPAGATIIKKGDLGDKFYMLKKGVVECRNIGDSTSVVELAPGSHFGERALTHRQPRACDVVAKTDIECITLSGQDFEALLGSVSEALDRMLVVNVVRALPKFDADAFDWRVMYELLEKQAIDQGTILDEPDVFWAVREGRVQVDGATVGPGEHFGHGFLQKSTTTTHGEAVAVTPVAAYSLRKKTLLQAVSKLATDEASFKSHSTKDAAFFASLKVGRTLGTGTFGRVKLAVDPDGATYALKLLVKQAMVDLNQAESVTLERSILMKLRHPFVLKCHATFQSAHVCYFVLEFIQGGELFSRVEGGVSERETSFHAACVIDALDHIHKKHVVYRDLKPENVLIDAHGYARIVDFGFAKNLDPKGAKKTYTILGTPEYLSPECVLGKGYGFEVDLWAFGVLVYEMLTGRSPFYASNPDDTMTIFRLIIAAHIKFHARKKPSGIMEAFVRSLLARDLKDRLGARQGAPGVKAHAVLADYNTDWEPLRRKQLTPPYVPHLANATDASAFDAYPEDMQVPRYKRENDIFDDFGPLVDAAHLET